MTTRLRLLGPILAVALVAAACGGAASPTPVVTDAPATAAPTASTAPAESSAPEAVCEDAAAFRASLEALTSLRLVEVGTSGVRAAVDDVKTSAEALLVSSRDLIGPPVTNLLAAVTALQATLTGLGDQPSLGAGLVAVRAAIAEIRSAADEVEAALETSCPTR
jgi:hypothetical protein